MPGQSRGHEVRRLWLEPQVSIHPEVAERDPLVRRRHHRSGKLLYQPAAAAARARRQGSDGRGAWADHSHHEPADRRTRHGRIHRRRGGSLGRARDRPSRRRRDRQHQPAFAGGACRTTRPSTRRHSSSASSTRASKRCSGRSGRATSRATIAVVWRSRCGRSSASVCWRLVRLQKQCWVDAQRAPRRNPRRERGHNHHNHYRYDERRPWRIVDAIRRRRRRAPASTARMSARYRMPIQSAPTAGCER